MAKSKPINAARENKSKLKRVGAERRKREIHFTFGNSGLISESNLKELIDGGFARLMARYIAAELGAKFKGAEDMMDH